MPELFHKDEKELEFFKVCESITRNAGRRIPVSDIVNQAIFTPASSFFLHPREYVKIIKGEGTCLPENSIKKELHLEILRRSREIRKTHPELKAHEIAKIVNEQKAPRFYISRKRATTMYYSLLKNNPK